MVISDNMNYASFKSKLDFVFILVVLIMHVKYATSDGNCTHITTKGTLELQNVTKALLEVYSTCFFGVQRVRFLTTYNITIKELLCYLPGNESSGITELSVRDSEIQTLASNSFIDLAKLTRLALDNNKIQTLNVKTFSGLPSLRFIHLSFNILTEIPSSVFCDLPRLQCLYLDNNRLKHIANDAFVNLANAAIMFKIHMQYNHLKELPYKLLSEVPVKNHLEVNARNNNITTISDEIRHFEALEILNMEFNSLERVSKNLAALQRLKYIFLNNNSLQTLPKEMLHILNRSDGIKDEINLEGNPWTCDCRLNWMIAFIQEHNITNDIVCSSPHLVRMIHFNMEDLQCDITTVKDTLSAQLITGIVGICLLGVCCVATTVICLLKTKVKQQKKSAKIVSRRHFSHARSVEDISRIHTTPLINNTLYDDYDTLKLQIGFTEKTLYGTLQLGKLLGRGAFGDVYVGFATGFSKSLEKVAVKKIKENATQIETESLIEEYQNLIEVGKHQNSIQVYGTGLINGSRIIVMELADNGDLLSYIRSLEANHRKVIQNLDKSEEKFYLVGKHARLFMLMWQVAKGMNYLTELKIVHRDLAARNILLTKDLIAKISDFGLSRDVYETGYYFQDSKGRLPYKWMSPEALSCGKYTTRSDVWSYGVLLWEVVTLGSSPYPGIPPNMLINMYNSGYIMPQPPLCPNNGYAIMSRCWQHTPGQRPEFKTLVKELDDIVQESAKERYLDVTQWKEVQHTL